MSDITLDPRDEFEKVFPLPKHVIRCGKGYACTEYNAWGAHNFIRQWEGWSAAMLQGAENAESTSGNSPVIPDGWVACSERMPEGMTDVSISNGHDVGQGWWDGDVWQSQHDYYSVPGEVTHWMPLPAAPQQEVTHALAKGMERYGDAMQELAKKEVK